jgi:hypothetical protein
MYRHMYNMAGKLLNCQRSGIEASRGECLEQALHAQLYSFFSWKKGDALVAFPLSVTRARSSFEKRRV